MPCFRGPVFSMFRKSALSAVISIALFWPIECLAIPITIKTDPSQLTVTTPLQDDKAFGVTVSGTAPGTGDVDGGVTVQARGTNVGSNTFSVSIGSTAPNVRNFSELVLILILAAELNQIEPEGGDVGLSVSATGNFTPFVPPEVVMDPEPQTIMILSTAILLCILCLWRKRTLEAKAH
jgi:hypothetical protein